MGQAPSTTAELSEYVHTNELLYHRSGLATANISHLPDLSPFPRASGSGAAAPPPYSAGRPTPTKKQGRSMSRSASKHTRQARSARSRAGSVSSRGAATAAPAAGGGARKGDAPRPHAQKRPSVTSRRSGVERRRTKERGWKAVCEGQNRAGIVFEPVGLAAASPAAGTGMTLAAQIPTPVLPALVNIPRIDIVESSPIMRQLSGSGAARPIAPDVKVDTVTSPFAAAAAAASASASAPPFARSPSMPAVLVEPVPTYMGTPRPILSRPTSSPASPTAPGFTAALPLPLPGSPVASAFTLVNYEAASPGFAERMLAHEPEGGDSPSTSSSSGSEYDEEEPGGNERAYAELMAGRDDPLSRSVDSVVTQQIRILRVTNPDPDPDAEAEAPLSAAVPTTTRTPATLAEKRHVSAPPAHLRIVSLPSTPERREKEGYPRLLSPATPSTPTSVSSNVLKSGSGSGSGFSTPATSAPSTPVKAARVSAPVDIGAPASPTLRDARPPSPVAAFAPSPARKATAVQPASPLPSSRRASYLSRSRSDSHGSSDGDRSGTGSSASGLTSEEHVGKRQRRKGRRGRPSAAATLKVAAKYEGTPLSSPARKQQRPPLLPSRKAPALPDREKLDMPRSPDPTPAPTLVSLNLDPERLSKSCSLPSLAVPAEFLPPRSPRPPTTPRLEQAGTVRSSSAQHLAPPPSASTPDNPYALPLPSPVSPLRMDWFTTDLLVRCGIQTSTLAPIPPPSPNRQTLSPGPGSYLGLGMGHPAALQPRAVSSPMPLPSSSTRGLCPLPGTPLGHNFLDALELDTSPLFPSTSLDPALVGADPGPAGQGKESEKKGKRVETPRERRERKHRETQARYEAFDQLAQMAVESPGGNPFVDAGNGAIRLGEYKRGFDDREIWKWARAVSKATLAGEMVDDRKARRKERGR